jgi:hypothetical protein
MRPQQHEWTHRFGNLTCKSVRYKQTKYEHLHRSRTNASQGELHEFGCTFRIHRAVAQELVVTGEWSNPLCSLYRNTKGRAAEQLLQIVRHSNMIQPRVVQGIIARQVCDQQTPVTWDANTERKPQHRHVTASVGVLIGTRERYYNQHYVIILECLNAIEHHCQTSLSH